MAAASSTAPTADIALIGLAVMGQNIILNMNDNGYVVTAYNRSTEKVQRFLDNEAKGTNIIGAFSIKEMIDTLKSPRRVMLLVKAGDPVDAFIEQLIPHMDQGDIIIDGGNSHFPDTQRRYLSLQKKGIHFIGCGVSGGEDGARYGPSMMPGGVKEAWPYVKPIFQAICAKSQGEPCCDWVGEGASGHYVKMVHNGIEYGDMQLICEAYHLMKQGLGMTPDEISAVFGQWNEGELESYLIEISRDILAFKDTDGSPLVEKIRDTAGQKGTGKWTGIQSLDLGVPVTLIGESVFARCLSALQAERIRASRVLQGPQGDNPDIHIGGTDTSEGRATFVEKIRQALYASKIISYAQGFMLLREAGKEFKWDLNYGAIALMWRGGCIIRSRFLGEIKKAFQADAELTNLLLADFFKNAIHSAQKAWREVVAEAVLIGVPTSCFSTALAFYDGYRTARLPANLLQAQRDFFGAHTYELLDNPGTFHHTNWTGHGGDVSSSTYVV